MLLSAVTLSGSAMGVQEIVVEDSTADAVIEVTEDSSNATVAFRSPVPAAQPIPKLTGSDIADILAVAKSQVGYVSGKEDSVYVQELGLDTGRWCSEFIRWCARKAGAEDLFPEVWKSRSARHFVEYYGSLGRYYQVSGNYYRSEAAKTIGMSDIRPGDIVIVDLNDRLSDGAEHTALVQAVAKDRVLCVDGNYGGRVCNVERNAKWIHGVCRPNYTGALDAAQTKQDKTLKAPKYVLTEFYNTEAGIQLSWRKVARAQGYQIFRKSGRSAWQCIGILDQGNITRYIDKVAVSGTLYQYKVRAFRGSAVGSFSKSKTMYRLEKRSIQTSSTKKNLTIAWNTDAKAEGYHIQYAQNSTLTSGLVSLYVKGSKTKRRVIRSLRAGKTYYVRVRSYKYVGGTQYFSAWSNLTPTVIR